MSHDLQRVIRAAGAGAWFIEPRKADQMIAALELRLAAGPRGEAWADKPNTQAAAGPLVSRGGRSVRILRLHGAIMPRGNMMSDMSGAASLDRFQAAFKEAAADTNTSAIVIDVDSPGGRVDMVPETAEMIQAARRADRPIIAVANTLAASAAYFLATAADELVVTPSGEVGSIGVYMIHEDISEALQAQGIKPTFIYDGPRKVEGNPFGPLDPAARDALQAGVRYHYDLFTNHVAKARKVPVSTVRADPEAGGAHFGGGRTYPAREAVRLGMADSVETLEQVVQRALAGRRRATRRSAAVERERLALI